MQELETQLEDIAFRSVPVRLATLLLRLAGDSKDEAPIAATVGGLTHQDLADMLGVYRETVTTALDKFRNNDLIAIGRRQLSSATSRGCASWPQPAANRRSPQRG